MLFKGKAAGECIEDARINDKFLETRMTNNRGYRLFPLRDFSANGSRFLGK